MPGDDKPAVDDSEHTTPYYYSTRFDESRIRTEFAPTHQLATSASPFPAVELRCM